jgi:hypothetical protein
LRKAYWILFFLYHKTPEYKSYKIWLGASRFWSSSKINLRFDVNGNFVNIPKNWRTNQQELLSYTSSYPIVYEI